MRFQERRARRFGIRQIRAHEPVCPTARKDDRLDVDAFCVVAVFFVELRELTDATLDHVRLRTVGVIKEGDVGFHRGSRSRRQLVFIAEPQDGMRPDDEDVAVS